jgi:hypothetical protein
MTDRPEEKLVSTTIPTVTASVGYQIRRRYTAEELLKGAEHVPELNKKTQWAREGRSVGREIP